MIYGRLGRRASRGGEGEHEYRAVIEFAFGADRAAVGADYVFDNREAEARASRRAGAGLVNAVEALEQAGQMLGRYAGTEVADVEFHGVGDMARSQHNPATRCAVLECVID